MNVFDRIGIGTAAWGQEYRGYKVPRKEIEKILDCCEEFGIKFIDTATAYKCDKIMKKALRGRNFVVQVKLQDEKKEVIPEYATYTISHGHIPRGFESSEIVQVPFSIIDHTYERSLSRWAQIRSVFCGGKVFDPGFHSKVRALHDRCKLRRERVSVACVKHCLMYPCDKVILGVKNAEELKEIVVGLTEDYLHIPGLDTRML